MVVVSTSPLAFIQSVGSDTVIDESSPHAVLVVGATGGLGARITHHVLAAATREVRVMARPRTAVTPRTKALLHDFAARGATGPGIDVVTVDDAARVTAQAALDPDLVSGTVAVVGDRISPLRMGTVVERITGVSYALFRRGSIR